MNGIRFVEMEKAAFGKVLKDRSFHVEGVVGVHDAQFDYIANKHGSMQSSFGSYFTPDYGPPCLMFCMESDAQFYALSPYNEELGVPNNNISKAWTIWCELRGL